MFERTNSLPIFSVIAAFIDLLEVFWIYLIIKKSSPDMREYKWALLKLACCDLLFTLSVSLFAVPDFLFPAPAAAVLGTLRFLGPEHGPFLTFSWGLSSGALIYTAVNDCVYTRSLLVHGNMDAIRFLFSWKGWTVVVIINIIFCSWLTFVMYFALLDKEGVYDYCIRHGCTDMLQYYYNQTDSVIVAVNLEGMSSFLLASTLVIGVIIMHSGNFIASYLTLKKLRENRSSMSSSTYRAQRQLSVMLVAQNIYPLAAIGGPVAFTVICASFLSIEFLDSDVIRHLYFIALLCYPLFSSVFGIAYVRSHREVVFSILRRVLALIPWCSNRYSAKVHTILVEPTATSGVYPTNTNQ